MLKRSLRENSDNPNEQIGNIAENGNSRKESKGNAGNKKYSNRNED